MNRNILKSESPQEAWASRPQRSIPAGGTPTLLELLSYGFFAATRRAPQHNPTSHGQGFKTKEKIGI